MARFSDQSLALQLSLGAAGFTLVAGLCLLWMTIRASDYISEQQEKSYAGALAEEAADLLRDSLQSSDLLAARATLQRFVDRSLVRSIEVRDVEGAALGSAGPAVPDQTGHSAPITIGGDIAGEVTLVIDSEARDESRWRFLSSLLALVAALSLLVFLLARLYSQRIVARLLALEYELTLPTAEEYGDDANELERLERRVADLPLDLLRGHAPVPAAASNFQESVLLFVHLASLARYVDTLSESNLHRYTRRLQQIVQAAAHGYRGELKVPRPFGLMLSFAPLPNAGNEVLRAACCARLINRVARGLEARTSLSIELSMALGHFEEDADGVGDIYPELYLQGAIDELHATCLLPRGEGSILVGDAIASADQLASATFAVVPEGDAGSLESAGADSHAAHTGAAAATAALHELQRLGDEQEALLEQQAELIIERIAPKRDRRA